MSPALAAALRLDHTFQQKAEEGFLADVLAGLRQRQKALPPKYFYDATGSHLFDRICELPEYYPTRTEIGILREASGAIAQRAGPDVAVVEFGSGSSTKVRILLDALENPAAYVPIDICGPHLLAASAALEADHPGLAVMPIDADFTEAVSLPEAIHNHPRLGFFPGSTIGNFPPSQAREFLARAAGALGSGARFLVGVDLRKSAAILHAAYNDRQGVTAAFNLNLLARMNRELGADFNLRAFRHRAFYDPTPGRIEMHLESLRPQTVHIAGNAFAFREGETIHTESSYKYTVEGFQKLASEAGWRPVDCFTDPERLFSVHYLVR